MRKTAILLALASTALAAPAFARDKSWYVGVEGGGMIVEDINYSVVPSGSQTKSDHKYGYCTDGEPQNPYSGSDAGTVHTRPDEIAEADEDQHNRRCHCFPSRKAFSPTIRAATPDRRMD